MGEDLVSVKIPKALHERIRTSYVEAGDFENVEEFVRFVLEEMLSKEDEKVYTAEEEEKIKERLRSLGYL